MAAGRLPSTTTCANCKALYQIVSVSTGGASDDVPCQVCGSPLAGARDGLFLKYFLLRKSARVQIAPARKRTT
jgi:predicted Zn finger-like uncharacterized protein